jgi:hypothetical protein
MTSSNQSFYILSDDEEPSEEFFTFLSQEFRLFINNYHIQYISDTDDEELPELIDELSELIDDLPELIDELPELVNNFIEPPFIHDEYKCVVTEEVYDKLKKQSIQFKDLEEVEKIKNIDCPISLEKFNNEDYIIKLNCGHIFHKEPILYWLYMQKNKCPICRYEYPFIEKRII